MIPFAIPDHDRRLLPEGRLTGPMPWVIAIMAFLTMLAAGTALGIAGTIRAIGGDLGHRATVQVVAMNPAQRSTDVARVVAFLTHDPMTAGRVADVMVEPQARARALVAPWLGTDPEAAGITVPALIDVRLTSGTGQATAAAIGAGVTAAVPDARMDLNDRWIAPLVDLMRSIAWLAGGLVALLAVATGATVTLAARGALDMHRVTIATMHLLGATDRQITRLFRRRLALDALFGGLTGFVAGLAALALLGWQVAAVAGPMATGRALPWYAWALLLAVPAGIIVVASIVARWAVMRALRRML